MTLDGTQEVLDLGCGTGQIAVPVAPQVARALTVDPEPRMLTEGQRRAEQRGVTNIAWVVGESYHLADLGLARRAGSTTYTPPPERHAKILSRSPFSRVDTVEWNWTLQRDLDSQVGLQFSHSYLAPSQRRTAQSV